MQDRIGFAPAAGRKAPRPNRLTAPVRFARRMLRLPIRVAVFHSRARFTAWRIGDDAPKGALRPADLAQLLKIADGRRNVVELGTSKAWTAISLALADTDRTVTTYDPVVQLVRDRYARLAGARVRDRIRFVDGPGETGPLGDDAVVDLLFIDASHEHAPTVREYKAWKPFLSDDAIVVFDDYNHPDFPGVRAAVDELQLRGRSYGFLFVTR